MSRPTFSPFVPAPLLSRLPRESRCSQIVFLILLLVVFAGCQTKPEIVVEAIPEPEPVLVLPSAAPIVNPSEIDIRFAQTTLNQLGFKLGTVDGIWGPRSAKAIRKFEQSNQLKGANGRLSELNLNYLEQATQISRNDIQKPTLPRRSTLASKLDTSVPLEAAPQLIMIDKPYTLMAKPNAFAERLKTLNIGTGVYVIRLQEGWYEVESEDRQRGFIADN